MLDYIHIFFLRLDILMLFAKVLFAKLFLCSSQALIFFRGSDTDYIEVFQNATKPKIVISSI